MKLSSRNKLLKESDEILQGMKQQIQAIPELSNLIKKIKAENPYRYSDEELEQMLVPWFIKNYMFKQVGQSISIGSDEPPYDRNADISKPYDAWYLSNYDKKRIKDGLEKVRKAALKRKNIIDSGQEPPGGYDEDLAIQRKLIIQLKGLPAEDDIFERVIFWWKKTWTDTGSFFDWTTGIAYGKNGLPISGNRFKMILELIAKHIQSEQKKNVDNVSELLAKCASLLWSSED